MEQLRDRVTHEHFVLPNVDLVIEPPAADGDAITWYYYYARHDNRTLLWLDDYELPGVSELEGVPSHSQLRKNTMLEGTQTESN